MLAALKRLLHLEKTNIRLAEQLRAKEQALLTLRENFEDAIRRFDGMVLAYNALKRECEVSTPISTRSVLVEVVAALGLSEWSTAEHAEEILSELIEVYHPKGVAALCAEAV